MEESRHFNWSQTELTRAVKAADLHRVCQESQSTLNELYLDAQGENEATLLHFAAKENLTGSMEVLINARASLRAGDSNFDMKPLAWAAQSGNVEAIVMLIRAGADVNASDDTGHTAIYYAQCGGHTQAVQILTGNLTSCNSSQPQSDHQDALSLGENSISIYGVNETFEALNLKKELLDAIYEMGFKKPSMIQATALPLILRRRNIIVQAHHGCGKTATFVLAMLSVVDVTQNTPQAICLCTTRELAVQIIGIVESLGKYIGVRAYMAVAGVARKPITHHIVVGTPGAVFLRLGKEIPAPERNIRMVVFDEADVLVNENDGVRGGGAGRGGRGGGRGGMQGGPQREGLVQQAARVKKACAMAQVLLFSATFGDDVMGFAERTAPNATKITLQKDKLALPNIVQLTMNCIDFDDKYAQLATIYEEIDATQCIIFCNAEETVDVITNFLRANGFCASVIHGKMELSERDAVVAHFRNGRTKVLVSTDLLSRGLDFPRVSLIINFDVPVKPTRAGIVPDPETYLYRIGHAGRFGRKGCAINLTHDDASRKAVQFFEKKYSRPTIQVARGNMEELIMAACGSISLCPDDQMVD